MKKKLIYLTIALLLLQITTTFAAPPIDIEAENTPIPFNTSMGKPYIDTAGRTMIPLKAISETLGHQVSWNSETRTVSIDNTIRVTLGSNIINNNGNHQAMDTVAAVKDGRTYVPLKFVGEALGYEVAYKAPAQENGNRHQISILGADTVAVAKNPNTPNTSGPVLPEPVPPQELAEDPNCNYTKAVKRIYAHPERDALLELVKNLNDNEERFVLTIKDFPTYRENPFEIFDIVKPLLNFSGQEIKSKHYQYNGRDINEQGTQIRITMEYRTSKEDQTTMDKELEKVSGKIIQSTMTDQQKVKAIADYVVRTVDYDYSFTNYNHYEAFTMGNATCNGFSMLAQQLFKMNGIQSIIVVGEYVDDRGAGSHAWNMVKLDGEWTTIDTTFMKTARNNSKWYGFTEKDAIRHGYVWDKSVYPEATASISY